MLNKKILAIALNLILTVGTIVCVGYAKEDNSLGTETPPVVLASVAPAPGELVPQVRIYMEQGQEEKYMGVGEKLKLSAELAGVPEGTQAAYQWQQKKSGGGWLSAGEGSQNPSLEIKLGKAGKMQDVYRCLVKIGGSEEMFPSNELTVSKIVYNKQIKVNLGQSFTVEDILGVPLKEAVEVAEGDCYPSDEKKNESKCIGISKKKGKKIFTVIKYCQKIPFEVELGKDGDKGGFASNILVKKPSIKDYKKDIDIKVTKNKTKLTVKFKNTIGISKIQFKPKGLEIDTIKKKEGKRDCTVVYRYKAKFKMKEFKVRYWYKPLAGKKMIHTKWVKVFK